MDFPDDSNPFENFKHLNEIITAIHMSEYPACYKDGKPLFSSYQGDEETGKAVQVTKVSDAVNGVIGDIDKCETLEQLKSYWLISKGNLSLSEAYKAKEKQLQSS